METFLQKELFDIVESAYNKIAQESAKYRKKGAKSARIYFAHLFALNPCKNRVQIPKFGANQTSGSGDIANPKCMCENPVRAKIGFAISPEPLIRFASNFGIWTWFLQGLRVKRWAKSIRVLFAPFVLFFALSCAILFYAFSTESNSTFSKKVSIW